MEVHLNPEVHAKLSRIAAERGSDAELLARRAIEHFVEYDEWFLREVGKGISAADRGDFVEHDDIAKMIHSRYPA
ncbi:MAG: hypothetical protein ABJC09_16605 [Terriglobia bacterium]